MNANPVYWKQRNGVLISIDNMDINHLRNTLKMIVNNSNKHKEQKEQKYKIVQVYDEHDWQAIPVLNGDMANEFNNNFHSDEYDECDATEIDIY
jgi:hypothetical protein